MAQPKMMNYTFITDEQGEIAMWCKACSKFWILKQTPEPWDLWDVYQHAKLHNQQCYVLNPERASKFE